MNLTRPHDQKLLVAVLTCLFQVVDLLSITLVLIIYTSIHYSEHLTSPTLQPPHHHTSSPHHRPINFADRQECCIVGRLQATHSLFTPTPPVEEKQT